MPRPKPVRSRISKHIQLDAALTHEVEAHLRDPLSGEIPYGAWRGLIERQLRNWLRERSGSASPSPTPSPSPTSLDDLFDDKE